MQSQNRCFTVFRIIGNFDTDKIIELLDLTPDRVWKIGDTNARGIVRDHALVEIGFCDDYSSYVSLQMEKTISALAGKISILNKIRSDYNASFYLAVVPEILQDNPTPALAPSLLVIDFCHATRTEIDIDLAIVDY